MKLLHLSDLHFHAEGRPWRSLDLRQRLAHAEFAWQGRPALFRDAGKVVEQLLVKAGREGINHVLVTGDLTAVSLREELVAAREALAPFAGRLTVLPGNHDRTSRRSAGLFEKVFGDTLHSELPGVRARGAFPLVHFVGADVAIVALDSGRVPLVPGLAQGRVGAAQLDALTHILTHPKLVGRRTVVAVHHAPFRPDGTPDKWTHGLVDATRLLEIVDRHQVAALCHGHIHYRYASKSPGQTPLFGAGSSTQLGRRGFVQLEIDGAGLHRSFLHTLGGPESSTSREPVPAER